MYDISLIMHDGFIIVGIFWIAYWVISPRN